MSTKGSHGCARCHTWSWRYSVVQRETIDVLEVHAQTGRLFLMTTQTNSDAGRAAARRGLPPIARSVT